MTLQTLRSFVALLAITCFAALPGCSGPSDPTAATEETEETSADQHEEGHGGEKHEHAEHEHAEHEHAEHEQAEHDHGDEEHSHDFESLEAATTEIKSLNGEIKAAMEKGEPHAAHDQLHHIGEVLIATEGFVEKMETSERKEQVSEAVQSLIEDFMAVDGKMHGEAAEEDDAATVYQDRASSISEAIETLETKDAS
jgi:uncharacterized protein involved in copper resistance